MGRYYWQKKATVEESLDVSVHDLKKRGMFAGHTSAVFSWVSSRSKTESSVVVDVDMADEPYARFTYSIMDQNGERIDYCDRVRLTTTLCNYGGQRYWFLCPICCRRVGSLYVAPGDVHFGCRLCNNLTYRSRNRSPMERFGHIGRQAKRLRGQIKRWTYRSRPTRRVQRLRALERNEGVLLGYAFGRLERLRRRSS
jgi:hypothetical protein